MSLENLRKNYTQGGLTEHDLLPDPFEQFNHWFETAKKEIDDPYFEVNAMALATADSAGNISNRIVLLKGFDQTGFRFYSNYQSRKAAQMEANPHACLLFYWPQLERQIRIEGTVTKTSAALSDEYFTARPRLSRISAVISPQSKPIEDRRFLDDEFEKFRRGNEEQEFDRPDYWGGYIVVPRLFEFWQGRENRLHDRLQYVQQDDDWSIERLGP